MGTLRSIAGTIVVAGAISIPTLAQSTHPDVQGLALIIEDARSRIESVSYSYSLEQVRYFSDRGKLTSSVQATVRQKGDLRATDRLALVTLDDLGTTHASFVRTVLNDRYFASRNSDSPVQLYAHEGINHMSHAAKVYAKANSATDLMLFGFGSGDDTLKDAIAHPDKSIFWETRSARNGDGQRVLEVLRFTPLNPQLNTPTVVLQIDPAKGYLITRVVGNDQDGNVGLVRDVKIARIGESNIWFPVELEETIYASLFGPEQVIASMKGTPHLDDNGRRVGMTRRIRLIDIRVNHELDEREFTISGLKLWDNYPVAWIGPDGSLQPHVYLNGVLVPVDRSAEHQLVLPANDEGGALIMAPAVPDSIQVNMSAQTGDQTIVEIAETREFGTDDRLTLLAFVGLASICLVVSLIRRVYCPSVRRIG